MATTGGGFVDEGQKDHIMWITMGKEEPIIANLTLDGISDENFHKPQQETKSEQSQPDASAKITPVDSMSRVYPDLSPSAVAVDVTDDNQATWVGGGTEGSPGLWSVGTNWSGKSPPGRQEDTYITNGSYVNSDMDINAGLLTIDGGSTVNVDAVNMGSNNFDNHGGTNLYYGTLNVKNHKYLTTDNDAFIGGPHAAQPGVVNLSGPDDTTVIWQCTGGRNVFGGNDGVNDYNYGVLNIDSGLLNAGWINFGYAADCYGELNLSGGKMTLGSVSTGSHNGTSVLNVTGGTMEVSGDFELSIWGASTSDVIQTGGIINVGGSLYGSWFGTTKYSISGGTLTCASLVNGRNGSTGVSTFEAIGGSATISAGSFYSNPQSILKIVIGSDGVSTIDVSGSAEFEKGSKLDMTLDDNVTIEEPTEFIILAAQGGINDKGLIKAGDSRGYWNFEITTHDDDTVLVVTYTNVWSAENFYIDSINGNDSDDGKTQETAWKTLANVNAYMFSPGDVIHLKCGSTFSSGLNLQGSGTSDMPIIVNTYGTGNKPRISGELTLLNVEYWEVNNIEIDRQNASGSGVRVVADNFGCANHLYFKNLDIKNAKGNLSGDDGGFWIKFTWSSVDTWFNDLLIENCTITNCDRNGILITDWPAHDQGSRSTNVVIRGNEINNVGGDGIFWVNCDGALVENNVVRYAQQRATNRACAGLWPHTCSGSVIQYNEVSHTAVGGVRVWDSEGFNCDADCTDTIFQYNYSHDNLGGFLLLCGGCSDTIVRYNISQNDKIATFSAEQGVTNASIYNNVIYVPEGQTVNMTRTTTSGNGNFQYYNNIFYADGTMNYDFGSMTNLTFENNSFYGNHVSPPVDLNTIVGNPLLVNPGSGGNGIGTVAGYQIQAGSPCIAAGKIISGNGGLDFLGNTVPAASSPDVGAHQLSSFCTAVIPCQKISGGSYYRWK